VYRSAIPAKELQTTFLCRWLGCCSGDLILRVLELETGLVMFSTKTQVAI